MNHNELQGAGLGLRRSMIDELTCLPPGEVDFLEVTPENWMHLGGAYNRKLRAITARYPLVCHGLSLNLGGPAPLDADHINSLKAFLETHEVLCFSEHLSYCGDEGHLYDLMPIPFTDAAIRYVAERIQRVQDQLQRRIAVENVSYYAAPSPQLSEIEFINAVVAEADCDLLLDVNNVYVNSVNHGYDPHGFVDAMPKQRIAYLHVAGHYRENESLIIDSHGAAVIDPVWQLLEYTYQTLGVKPTLLERDFNLPPLEELLMEVTTIADHQKHGVHNAKHAA